MMMEPTVPEELVLIRYLRGHASPSEAQQVEAWIDQRVENKQIVAKLALLDHAQQTLVRISGRDPKLALMKLTHQIKRRSLVRMLKRVSVAAAILFGILTIGIYFFPRQQSGNAIADTTMVTLYAKDHLRTPISLPDGTIVYLNAGSQLTYAKPFAENHRLVSITGEAFFEVVADANRPFLVRTAHDELTIRVLGTVFNVNAYPGQQMIRTTLVSGSVQLQVPGVKEKIFLKPTQRALFSPKDNKLKLETVDVSDEIEWRKDRLVFKNTPMDEVLRRVAQFYDVVFKIESPVIHTYKFTGSFEGKTLDDVLNYMKISSKMKYSIKRESPGDKPVVTCEIN
ncbi:anti-sigma factor [Sphingobacterium alkalisoli]|nr:FecR domain-containing protein [Sphingobacterium alkalisoli]GGH15557.1 anti-sigma factor [Sphingobacterium alkalisoli]